MKYFHPLPWSIGVLLGCSAPAAPLGGAISITASVTGGGSDPNGFEVVIDRRIALPLNESSTLVHGPIEAGRHDLELTGLSAGCRADGGATLQTTVSEGDTARVEFIIACDPTGGLIEVAVSTSGTDLDPNGYSVTVDEVALGDVPRVGRFSGSAPAGRRLVGLHGLTANCSAGDENPQVVSVPIGGIVGLDFQVECTPAAPAGRGHELAFVRNRDEGEASLMLINDDGTASRLLLMVRDSVFERPAWSPDGSRIAGVFRHQFGSPDKLVVFDLASGILSKVPNSEDAGPPAWSADGRSLIFSQSDLETFTSQIFRMDLDGNNREQLTASDLASAYQPTMSPDGTRIAYIQEDHQAPRELRVLTLADRSTRTLVIGESEFSDLGDPAWSPDGTYIAFEQQVDFRSQIFVIRVDDGRSRQVTNGFQPSFQPSWSPDSRTIAFHRGNDEAAELYLIDVESTDEIRISDNEHADQEPAWRP